jgi:dipeptidase E
MAKEEGVEQIKQSVQNTKAKELLVIIENTNQKYEQLKELYEKCIISNKNKIMKLLLASDGKFVIEEGYKILGIPKDQIHIGYITTASKGATNTEYIKIHKQLMKESGYSFEEIDIENKNESELKKFFSDKNIIHMEGGNTFYLLKAIKKFGFDKILREFINEGKIYIGTSAGTSIMGPDISISSHKPEGISKDELIGLKLVPFLIKCHYTDEKKVEYLERLKNLEYPVRFLRDGQGILVEDDKYTFIGKEDEVIIKS